MDRYQLLKQISALTTATNTYDGIMTYAANVTTLKQNRY